MYKDKKSKDPGTNCYKLEISLSYSAFMELNRLTIRSLILDRWGIPFPTVSPSMYCFVFDRCFRNDSPIRRNRACFTEKAPFLSLVGETTVTTSCWEAHSWFHKHILPCRQNVLHPSEQHFWSTLPQSLSLTHSLVSNLIHLGRPKNLGHSPGLCSGQNAIR